MLSYLKRIFSGEQMNEPQTETLEQLPDDGSCPDCRKGPLIAGPRGGAARNVLCDNCLSEFNVLVPTGHIIDRMGKCSPARAWAIYHIKT